MRKGTKFAIVLPLILAPPAITLVLVLASAGDPTEGPGVLFGFISLIVSLPLGLCYSADLVGSRRPAGLLVSIVRQALRVPVLLLGITAVLIGVAVLAWIVFGILSFAFGKGVREFGPFQLIRVPVGALMFYGLIRFGTALVKLSLGLGQPMEIKKEIKDEHGVRLSF